MSTLHILLILNSSKKQKDSGSDEIHANWTLLELFELSAHFDTAKTQNIQPAYILRTLTLSSPHSYDVCKNVFDIQAKIKLKKHVF